MWAARVGQLAEAQTAVVGNGALRRFVGIGHAVGNFIQRFFQRVVDAAAAMQPAAHDGQIRFADLLCFKLLRQQAGGVAVEGKQQYAGGGAVEAVHGENVLANLVAQGLHGKAGFVPIEPASVHQHARRFADGH